MEQLVNRLKANHGLAVRQVEIEQKAVESAEIAENTAQEAQELAQTLAQAVQQRVHQQVASVVTRCLRAVFGEEAYEFKIQFEQKRGKTEAKLLFERDGMEVNPLQASGGGPVDVAAFALRLAALTLSRPRKRKVLCLDEPFRFVSKEYWNALQEMLLGVSRELGVQLIFVTHEEGLKVGKVIEIS